MEEIWRRTGYLPITLSSKSGLPHVLCKAVGRSNSIFKAPFQHPKNWHLYTHSEAPAMVRSASLPQRPENHLLRLLAQAQRGSNPSPRCLLLPLSATSELPFPSVKWSITCYDWFPVLKPSCFEMSQWFLFSWPEFDGVCLRVQAVEWTDRQLRVPKTGEK